MLRFDEATHHVKTIPVIVDAELQSRRCSHSQVTVFINTDNSGPLTCTFSFMSTAR